MKSVIVIGGGLSGLVTATLLSRAGISTTLIEKKAYPLHRVCGEYISNEVVPFLKRNGLYPESFNPPQIQTFTLTSTNGKQVTMPLDLGGFGISRFSFDHFLYQQAVASGVQVSLHEEIIDISFDSDRFYVKSSTKEYEADLVVGAYGKRSRIDSILNRNFFRIRSPYVGVKYHVRTDHPQDKISLHNFRGGYCGVSNVEDGITNLCYLTLREPMKHYGEIATFEQAVLFENPLLRKLFSESTHLFRRPEVINEVSFATKEPVYNHILMTGDAAGMIAPLCGNGMAMAIHTAKIVTECIIDFCHSVISRDEMERRYHREWDQLFKWRLWRGRQIQKLFGSAMLSNLACNIVQRSPAVAREMMKSTHGDPF